MLTNERDHRRLAFQVLRSHCTKLVIFTTPALLRTHPLHAIKSLAEHVVGLRRSVTFLPQAQFVFVLAVFAIVAAQTADTSAVLLPIHRVQQVRVLPAPISTHRAALSSFHLGIRFNVANVDVVAFVCGIWFELGDYAVAFADSQRRQQRYSPARLRTGDFHAVQIHLASPTRAVGFHTQRIDLALHGLHQFTLCHGKPRMLGWCRPDDI